MVMMVLLLMQSAHHWVAIGVRRRPTHVRMLLLVRPTNYTILCNTAATAAAILTFPARSRSAAETYSSIRDGLILLNFVPFIMAARVVGGRAPVVGQVTPISRDPGLVVGMLLVVRMVGVLMAPVAVVVQPGAEHVEIGL
jgi:hypothetical protein